MIKVLLFAAVCGFAWGQYGYFNLGHGSYRVQRPLSYLGGHGYNRPYNGLRHNRGYSDRAPSYGPVGHGYAPSYGSAGHGYAPSYERAGHGYAPAHDSYSQPIPYDFGYDVHGDHGDQQHRRESGDGHGNVQGSYGYRDSYGLYRQVDYVADHHGFRADVKTNEPGTANQNPADVHVQSEQHGGHYGRHY